MTIGDGKGRRRSDSIPTPLQQPERTMLLVKASPTTRNACVQIAVENGLRAVVATWDNITAVATSTRPLVIVYETSQVPSEVALTDIAVGVGAQLVHVAEGEPLEQVRQKVSLAIVAARHLRCMR